MNTFREIRRPATLLNRTVLLRSVAHSITTSVGKTLPSGLVRENAEA